LPPLFPVGQKMASVVGRGKVQEALRRETPVSGNVMDFFKGMERGLEAQGKELDAEGKALKERLRIHQRAKRHRSKTSQKWESADFPRDRLGGARSSFQKSASCAALRQAARPGRADWELHEQAWEVFQDEPPELLYVEAVPWPPLIDDALEFCEELQAPGDRKKAYRLACRRWHPDKFLQRYGSRVTPKELPYMTFRLNEVFQAITSQWARLQLHG